MAKETVNKELLAACKDLLWQFLDRIEDPQDSELETVKFAQAAIARAERE